MYENFDYLLLRAKQMGTPDNILAKFPWIIWFIWKARNEKTFNGKQISPSDTMLHATQEEENWRVAQVIEKKDTTGGNHPSYSGNVENESHLPRCQVDASWVTNSTVFGGGFVFDLAPGTHRYGSLGMDQVLTPMHAEFTVLLNAMRCSLQLGFTSMSFESDCLQLVKLIDDEEDWPAMASEWNEFIHIVSSFTGFSISFIARERNVRADLLAKGARLKNSIFSHVNSEIPGWLAQQANIFLMN